MITRKEYEDIRTQILDRLEKAKIALTLKEKKEIEIADFGLGRVKEIGLGVVTYINTDRCCSKELVLLPRQICPEHRHPEVDGKPGKEETFRCRQGVVYLYVSGTPSSVIRGTIPEDKKDSFTVFHEVMLHPGEQYTLQPDTLHWFQGGDEGAIVSEFSTRSRDEADVFTDGEIRRAPEIAPASPADA